MDLDSLLQAIRNSLLAIVDPRFYESERGFQGQLLVELSSRVPELMPRNRGIIEQEHQKTLLNHNLTIRPDIIIHEPYDPEIHANRRQGNFAVIELKLYAGPKKAVEDFKSLYSMLTVLEYPVGIFININHTRTQVNHVPAEARGRIVSFATRLTQNGAQIVEDRT